MPELATACLTQDAVLYALAGVDDYGHHTVSSTGVAIKLRWETKQVEVIDAQGNTTMLESVAFVDRVIAIGSNIWLGKLADVPSPVTNLRQVVTYSEIPDTKGRNPRRMVGMMKSSNELNT